MPFVVRHDAGVDYTGGARAGGYAQGRQAADRYRIDLAAMNLRRDQAERQALQAEQSASLAERALNLRERQQVYQQETNAMLHEYRKERERLNRDEDKRQFDANHARMMEALGLQTKKFEFDVAEALAKANTEKEEAERFRAWYTAHKDRIDPSYRPGYEQAIAAGRPATIDPRSVIGVTPEEMADIEAYNADQLELYGDSLSPQGKAEIGAATKRKEYWNPEASHFKDDPTRQR